ncbi:jg6620 [Pararge aegeria aegeria]|uniref:Jg6620 protein n=1 Tax=Pararge aegeria aegeria TaxID=348720 RepID=A0A8S4QRM3_9NEOP|nr:jg6620 [Pararge aegeria aegeria]
MDFNVKNEQWVRRSNIQINGIPKRKDENLVNVITNLAKKSGYKLDPARNIDFVTRIAVKNDVDNSYPKPIIIKLLSRYKKDDLLSCLRRL